MLKKVLICICCLLVSVLGMAQVVTECPKNIGFETGTFMNWEASTGEIVTSAVTRRPVVTVSPSPFMQDRHTLLARGGIDPYGLFSTDAPNGSKYVVKLGNNIGGHQAEGISYTLDVPANVEEYSITFNYAVVFENPSHLRDEQPKFMARVVDLTTNTSTACGSFEFIAQNGLPGFKVSPIADSVLYRPWSPVMVNLSDYIGHKIRLEFITNDCSFNRHFGYAYIDFNENCSIPITGNISCPEAQSLTLTALPGFFSYRWFNASTKQDLGTSGSLELLPVPPSGTKIGVELIPYGDLGCPQTLYTTITAITLQVHDPPPECTFIDLTATAVTVGNSSDLTYTYWRDAAATVPLLNPDRVTVGGTYYIKGSSSSGCTKVVPVFANIVIPPSMGIKDPPPVTYPVTANLSTTFVHVPGMVYTYWVDQNASIPLRNPTDIRISGTYYIKVTDPKGCLRVEPVHVVVIIPDIIVNNTFTPNGDGINDVFTVLISDQVKVKYFRIFSRWGAIVYETTDITNYWDGFTNNSNASAGVYYWAIEGEINSKSYRRSGYITLIR